MNLSSLLGGWVIAGGTLMCLLVFAMTWFRTRRDRPLVRYQRLQRIEAITQASRIGSAVIGLTAAIFVTVFTPNQQAILIAPSLWALVTMIGIVVTDHILLGRPAVPAGTEARRGTVLNLLPWRLLLVLALMVSIIVYGARWAAGQAAIDGRSRVYSWVLDGVFDWGRSAFFPGRFYTLGLAFTVPVVLAATVGGIIVVFKRPLFLPSPKYLALDYGLRRRTIRDIVLVSLGAVSPVVAMMCLSIAWTYGSLGPGSPEHTLIVALSSVLAASGLVVSFWILANLIILPRVEEELYLLTPDQITEEERIEVSSSGRIQWGPAKGVRKETKEIVRKEPIAAMPGAAVFTSMVIKPPALVEPLPVADADMADITIDAPLEVESEVFGDTVDAPLTLDAVEGEGAVEIPPETEADAEAGADSGADAEVEPVPVEMTMADASPGDLTMAETVSGDDLMVTETESSEPADPFASLEEMEITPVDDQSVTAYPAPLTQPTSTTEHPAIELVPVNEPPTQTAPGLLDSSLTAAAQHPATAGVELSIIDDEPSDLFFGISEAAPLAGPSFLAAPTVAADNPVLPPGDTPGFFSRIRSKLQRPKVSEDGSVQQSPPVWRSLFTAGSAPEQPAPTAALPWIPLDKSSPQWRAATSELETPPVEPAPIQTAAPKPPVRIRKLRPIAQIKPPPAEPPKFMDRIRNTTPAETGQPDEIQATASKRSFSTKKRPPAPIQKRQN
ncbi:MAG: hypothetical protein FWD55_04560 [Propionibacteriaceae bacterium]|nr:hypothetical protein [Propionibacteriaceae bacterium]